MNYVEKINGVVTPQNKLSKIILILSISAGLMGIAHILNVYADKSSLDASSDLSTKINIGRSKIGENSSSNINTSSQDSNMNASIQANSDTNATIATRSNSESQDNRNAGSESISHDHYKMTYEKISANSEDEFTVQSERHLYKAGDNVTINGSIWSRLLSSIGTVNTVSIKVQDNSGNVLYDGKGQINGNGEYSAVFQIPPDAKKGAYNVDVVADVSADVLNTLSLKTKSTLEISTKIVIVNPNAVSVKADGKDFDVQMASNSTSVTDLNFDEQNKKLSFTVQGDAGTKGVTEITIPKSLLNGDFTVMIDGHAMAQSDVLETANTDTDTTLEINYHHSTHQIDIIGTNAVPEFSSLASIVLVVSISAIIGLSPKIRYLHR